MYITSRNLNYLAISNLKESGFSDEYILHSLVQALESNLVNDSFEYIYRMVDLQDSRSQEILEELEKYSRD